MPHSVHLYILNNYVQIFYSRNPDVSKKLRLSRKTQEWHSNVKGVATLHSTEQSSRACQLVVVITICPAVSLVI